MREEKIVAKVFDSQADTYGASTTAFGQFLADLKRKEFSESSLTLKDCFLMLVQGVVDMQSSLRKWV